MNKPYIGISIGILYDRVKHNRKDELLSAIPSHYKNRGTLLPNMTPITNDDQ